ncbi:nuclease [Mycobacterium heckeshornense]|uniref:TM0106 family RecB-like putative nuclease n=1 Tax=Mycobacterium heckeshornense TaxID=110505 RepID=UPI0006628D4D|nr:TM0106 family RecB-like putative nuclease [Mycobacterium heckeshornense]KMV22308.1 nuclease [Mycobacterium heckeshornense]MCV7034998.1 TM0106 family RecB-like putative nuclease [Mycobacterium heckeshornense]PIJ33281.1 nuclease [Mycobacterium heckeshornense]
MFVADDTVIYSASDLVAACRCEYALLRVFDAKLGRGPAVGVEDDDLLARAAALGDEHEQRRLDELRDQFGAVTVIGRPSATVAGLTAAAEATRRAVADGAPVVYQATVFDGRFAGFADFLIRDGDRYRVADTKLARSPHVTALLQLAAYADGLASSGVAVAPEAELILGDGAVARYRVDELIPVYLAQRAALQRLLDDHYAAGVPVRWDDEDVRACFGCPECQAQLRACDDLLLVAGMRISQRAKLVDAGITTVAQLAQHAGPVPHLAVRTLQNLTAQAKLQIAERRSGTPQFEIADPQPLAVLPDPDDGDLFFDFEGDPLWTVDGRDWGLEYLFGVLDARGGFRPLWAHSRADERKALSDFLAMVARRRKRYPNMHIYHYAPYEKTALLRLAGRHGVGEDEVDDLLRNGVLVDLYPLVRKSIRVGAESFSLKALEPLYMGTGLRCGEVTTAADSIAQYARFCELRDSGRADEAAAILREIEDYNHYDCRSTRALRDWLLIRAFESGVTPLGAQPVSGGDSIEQHDQLAVALANFAGDAAVSDRTPEQTAVALLAAARGYHRREDKPFWWAHFDRLNYPVDEWADNTDVFIVDQASVLSDWHQPPRARKPQRRVRLTGELARGELKADVFALYEPPAPAALTDDPDRRAAGRAQVVECDDPTVPTELVILERASHGKTFRQVPFALTPGPPLPTARLRESIESTAAEVAGGLPHLPRTALFDILLRRPPRTRGGAPLPRGADTATDITAALLDLDSSYVAVHGPPGTGKTYTAAKVITRLVNEHGWRIGVVAQSHAVVENLFDCAITVGMDPMRVGKKPHDRTNPRWRHIDESDYAAFISETSGCVIGGTAWDFANRTRVPAGSLDLLVIDEAGQFCLANTIAVAPAAANLLLLGDPQQLPQVSQGTHPEPVDTSALNWLAGGQRTLPAELGYFLDRSYRMHPAVCGPVSRLCYEGRLYSHTESTAARHLDGYPPGVHVLCVEHDGNSTDSPEEADAIVAEIRRLLGSSWTDEHGTRPLGTPDVLVLAPYNAQVVLLRERLAAARLDAVRVGTVDKFQGAQAPVVFISMTASSIDEVSRGMSFLLNRNRLNVAVSRAQYAAVIVRSLMLTHYLPGTPDSLMELGAFLTLTSGDMRAPRPCGGEHAERHGAPLRG